MVLQTVPVGAMSSRCVASTSCSMISRYGVAALLHRSSPVNVLQLSSRGLGIDNQTAAGAAILAFGQPASSLS